MLGSLQACYSPADIAMIVSMFVLVLAAIGSFTTLMVWLCKAAWLTVQDFKKS